MKTITFVALMLSFNLCFSESNSNLSTIKAITVGSGYARVRLESMKEAEGCVNTKNWYYLDTVNNQEMFSTLLAANISGKKLTLQLAGCQGEYPKISHIYLCDTLVCN